MGSESLRDYFSQFGEVQECTVMRDSATGRSRGFGFLTFRDPKTVNTVMVKEHYLDGKIVSYLFALISCTRKGEPVKLTIYAPKPKRLTQSEQFPETNKKRPARSLLEA